MRLRALPLTIGLTAATALSVWGATRIGLFGSAQPVLTCASPGTTLTFSEDGITLPLINGYGAPYRDANNLINMYGNMGSARGGPFLIVPGSGVMFAQTPTMEAVTYLTTAMPALNCQTLGCHNPAPTPLPAGATAPALSTKILSTVPTGQSNPEVTFTITFKDPANVARAVTAPGSSIRFWAPNTYFESYNAAGALIETISAGSDGYVRFTKGDVARLQTITYVGLMLDNFQYALTLDCCGDGRKSGTEACDDGNLTANDGCSPTCTIDPECSDGKDNDGDGNTDLGDQGCTSASDTDEANPTVDLRVNGQDGVVAVPRGTTVIVSWTSTDALRCDTGTSPAPWGPYASKGVSGNENFTVTGNYSFGIQCAELATSKMVAQDVSTAVRPTRCTDQIDNDGDGLVDGVDTGCTGVNDDDEGNTTQCNDGTDNDGNGKTDYPGDQGCVSAADNAEQSPTETCAPTDTRISCFKSAVGATVPASYGKNTDGSWVVIFSQTVTPETITAAATSCGLELLRPGNFTDQSIQAAMSPQLILPQGGTHKAAYAGTCDQATIGQFRTKGIAINPNVDCNQPYLGYSYLVEGTTASVGLDDKNGSGVYPAIACGTPMASSSSSAAGQSSSLAASAAWSSSSSSVTVCGDGTKSAAESCDDHNTNSGDGCSAACSIENGYSCTTAGQACATLCGDGIRVGSEACDDGNTNTGDGCGNCQPEDGWTCGNTTCVAQCGDGKQKGAEQCDDGNTYQNDGCSAACKVESGWTCTGSPSQCTKPATGNTASSVSAATVAAGSSHSSVPAQQFCGNAEIETGETCDDGNLSNADGCSASCVLETGWICAGQPSQCIKKPASSSKQTIPVTALSSSAQQSSIAPVSSVAMQLQSAPTVPRVSAVASQSKAPDMKPAAPMHVESSSISSILSAVTSLPQLPVAPFPVFSASVSSTPLDVVLQVQLSPGSSAMQDAVRQWKPICGNGIVEIGEACDRGARNGDDPTSDCTTRCTSSLRTLAATTLAAPIGVAPMAGTPPAPLSIPQQEVLIAALQPINVIPQPPTTAASGPGSLAVMAAGAASGIAWMRRKRL